MTDAPVTVVATMQAKPEKIEEAKKELQALLAPTRGEEGCINYDMHQDSSNPAAFLFYENWTSKSALDRHLQTPHLKAFMEKSGSFLTKPVDIGLWNKVEE